MIPVVPADRELATELRALEDRRIQALIDVDLDTLDEIFHPSLIHIHSPGLTHTKPELLAHIGGKRAFRGVERGDLHIRVLGDTAIIHGPLVNRMRGAEADVLLAGVATQIAVRTDTGWRYVHFQLTPTPTSTEQVQK